MTQHLHADLARLEQQLLYLAARVEEAVRKAIVSLVERRQDPALDVIEGDQHIDRREVELEEECLKILALHRPVANDLRFVTAVLKIDNDLERIGDLAVNIAKRAAFITTLVPTPVPAKMREMMEEAMHILRDAVDAFVRGDAQAARRVCREDERIDRFHKEIVKDLQTQMEAESSFVSYGLLMYSVSKSLERIADHATNIAEDVVYMVEGEIIRHSFRGVPDGGGAKAGRSI
jgi:phosphate transport system protein